MPPKLPLTPGPSGAVSSPTGLSQRPQYPSTPTATSSGNGSMAGVPPGSGQPGQGSTTSVGNSSSAAIPTGQFSQADLNRIVLEYLGKKGYSKTEAMLRMESAKGYNPHAPTPTGPTSTVTSSAPLKSTTDDPKLYIRAYVSLRDWIETSLDLFKPELRKLLFPVFVHTYFYLIQKQGSSLKESDNRETLAKKFFVTYSLDHTVLHGHDLQLLSGLTLPDHLQENETAKLYRNKKYRLNLSRTTFDLLLHFLDDNERNGGPVTIRLINQYIDTNVTATRPDRYDDRNQTLGPDEGIPGHLTSQEGMFNKQLVKLGKFPLDEKMAKDVELRLKEEDVKSGTSNSLIPEVPGNKSLVEEFHEQHKEDNASDSPLRDILPLPPFKGTDVEAEIEAVKDGRNRLKIGSVEASLPSVCMYTFHNTYDGLNTLQFSEDSTLVAGGFDDSYVKVWSLKGDKIRSALKNSVPSSSKRLVGHAGPVYGVSFSSDNKYLLSCSEDRTARLWSLDTYTALVSYKGHNHPVWDVAFSPFGHYFATASHDQTARLWSCDHIYPLRIFAGHLSDVNCVTFHPNSTYVVTGSSDHSCRMWDVSKGIPVRVMLTHSAPVSALTVSPDGRTLASAADDGSIIMWDLGSGRKLKTMLGHDRNTSIYSLSFSKEGSVLVSAGADFSVRAWDAKGGYTAPIGDLSTNLSTTSTSTEINSASNAVVNGISGNVDATKRTPAATATLPGPVVATADQMAVFKTKQTPVYKVQFTRRNLCLAGGAFLGAL
ncbi:WD40-repeat-containing domain protein [Lipomyces japonicus]|uniref:WD40-repeat-containing domain protein n=1 Tax=Lipomyces japonicus TaxID=56871 RepID=UPI0034CDDD12